MFIKSRGLGTSFVSVQTAEPQTRAMLVSRDRYTGSGWVLSKSLAQIKSPLSDQRGLALGNIEQEWEGI